MKKILMLIILILTVFVIYGCKSNKVVYGPTNEQNSDIHENSEEILKNEIYQSQYDATYVSLYVSDLVNTSENLWGSNEDGSTWYLQYSMRLPKLNFNEDIDKVINAKINEIFFSPLDKDIESKKATFEVNYELFEDEQYLSLLVVLHKGYSTSGYTIFTAVIDKELGQLLSFKDVVERFEIDNEEIDTVENMYSDLFYINQNKELCVFYKRTTLAGIESMYTYNFCTNDATGSVHVPN